MKRMMKRIDELIIVLKNISESAWRIARSIEYGIVAKREKTVVDNNKLEQELHSSFQAFLLAYSFLCVSGSGDKLEELKAMLNPLREITEHMEKIKIKPNNEKEEE